MKKVRNEKAKAVKENPSSRNTNRNETLVYCVKALDARAVNIESELKKSFDVMKEFAAKKPKKYKELSSLATHIFQVRFSEIVPIVGPIYFKAGKKDEKIKWQAAISQLLFPKISLLKDFINKNRSSWLSAISNSRIVLSDYFSDAQLADMKGDITRRVDSIGDDGLHGNVDGHGHWNAFMAEIMAGGGMVGDPEGHYSEEQEKIPTEDPDTDNHDIWTNHEATVDRSGKDNTVTYTSDNGFAKTTRVEHYSKEDGHYKGSKQGGGPASQKVKEYMEKNYKERPKKIPNPELDPPQTQAHIEAVMTLAVFRSEANQILRGLEIAGGGDVDAPSKLDNWHKFFSNKMIRDMFMKAFERHLEAERNKHGLREKRTIGGKLIMLYDGVTDPPRDSLRAKTGSRIAITIDNK